MSIKKFKKIIGCVPDYMFIRSLSKANNKRKKFPHVKWSKQNKINYF